ncbi:MAG: 3'-5' exonuclease [Clostridium sp.]
MKVIPNKEQKELIDELDRNILLIAPAGTGKTEAISERIVNIIRNNKAKPNEILCITFTNKACKEMKERIEKAVSNDSKDITVKTFHSFCLEIIKDNAKRKTDIFTDFTIIDEEDSKEIIEKINNVFSIKSMYDFISMVKDTRIKLNYITEDTVNDYNRVIKYLFNEKRKEIKEICTLKERGFDKNLFDALERYGDILVNKYNNELRKNHMLDFNDLIIEAKKLFEDEEIVNNYKNKYKYINIDEVQDTSFLEYRIIEKIFQGNNILFCGDKFQTIYGWRGSNPKKIEEDFKNKYNPRTIQFSKNYRGTKLLTKASDEYLKNAFNDEYKEVYLNDIEAVSDYEGEKITYKALSTRKEEAEYIKKEIDEIYNKDNSKKKICILTRSNFVNIELSEYLKNNSSKYEFALVDQYKFFRREEIKDITAFFKIIVNKNDSVSLERILNKFCKGIGVKTIEEIQSKHYKEVGIKLTDFIEEDITGEYFSNLLDIYDSNGTIIVFDVESTGTDVTKDEIIQIAAIKINKEGEVIDSFERFIKPNKSVGNSVLVHGFSDEYLKEYGEDKEKVFKEFLEYSKGALIVGHNVNYDISILNSELEKCKMNKPKFKGIYDTLDIYRRFYPNLPNHKLETLSKIFPIKHSPSHNALDDVKATAYLLVYAINEKIRKTSLERIGLMGKYIKSFKEVSLDINKLIRESYNKRPYEIIDYILNNFNFENKYGDKKEEKFNRINDFKEFLKMFDDKEKSSRDSLIEVVSLTSLSNGEIEEIMLERTGKERIPIITVHQSKGLEFDYVFLAGLEEKIFPSSQAINKGDLKEEKRLFYVAITRAKKKLYLTNSKINKWGRLADTSRFIKDINSKYLIY